MFKHISSIRTHRDMIIKRTDPDDDALFSDYRPKDELPEASAGFFSLLTYAWLTPIMWKINRKGTDFLQHMRCPDVNRAEINAER